MRYWITPDGSYYEGDYVAEGSIEVTERPADNMKYLNGEWVIDTEKVKEGIKAQLDEMELKALMPRGAREGWILLCEQQGQSAGLTKTQLYQANPFYKGLVDTDNAAKLLRAQL